MKRVITKIVAATLAMVMFVSCMPGEQTKVMASQKNTENDKVNYGITNVLFIGNSKTFYNDMPRMFYNLATKDENIEFKKLNVDVVTWGSKSLKFHNARFKDGINEINNNKKSTNKSVSEKQQNCYNKVLKSGTVYDYVIIQELSSNLLSEDKDITKSDYYKGAVSLKKTLLAGGLITNNTKFIVNSVWGENLNKLTLKKAKTMQNKIDKKSKAVVGALRNENNPDSCVAYTGKAILAFSKKYQSDESKKLSTYWKNKSKKYKTVSKYSFESAVFERTKNGKHVKVKKVLKASSDVILSDGRHPTQIGSLIEAAVLVKACWPDAQIKSTSYQGSVPYDFTNAKDKPYQIKDDISKCARKFSYRVSDDKKSGKYITYNIAYLCRGASSRDVIIKNSKLRKAIYSVAVETQK